jgi:flagellar basal-body rod protein FlgF
MDSPGYIILSRLVAQMRSTELAAHNLANADTPGFRATRPVFAEHLARQREVDMPRQGRDVAYSWDRATWRDTDPGPIQTTGNPLDIAIAGEGWFAVQTERGERYTRAGRFSIGANGQVVDQGGNPLLNANGQPITVAPNDTRLEVSGDGTLRSENGVIGRIRLVRFEDEQAMRAEGGRLFDAADQPPQEVAQPRLVQGALEGSNVQAVVELTRMMAELREFQLATQFMERDNERQQSAIDRLLRRRF